jgi:hypothetical protein
MYRSCLGLGILCVLTCAANAQVKPEWRLTPKYREHAGLALAIGPGPSAAWKTAPNQEFYVEVNSVNEQRMWMAQPVSTSREAARQAGSLMAFGGQPYLNPIPFRWLGTELIEAKQKIEHLTVLKLTVLEKNANGGFDIELRVVEARMSPPDSKPTNPLADKLKDVRIRVVLDSKLKVEKVKDYDAVLASVANVEPHQTSIATVLGGSLQGAKTLRNALVSRDKDGARFQLALSEEAITRSVNEVFGSLPDKEISARDTWSEESTERLPGLGSFSRSTKFKCTETGRLQTTISFTSTIKFEPAQSSATALPFRVRHAELTAETASGELTFDNLLGRLLRKESKMVVTGALTIRFGEGEGDVSSFFRQEVATTIRVLNEPPKAP